MLLEVQNFVLSGFRRRFSAGSEMSNKLRMMELHCKKNLFRAKIHVTHITEKQMDLFSLHIDIFHLALVNLLSVVQYHQGSTQSKITRMIFLSIITKSIRSKSRNVLLHISSFVS